MAKDIPKNRSRQRPTSNTYESMFYQNYQRTECIYLRLSQLDPSIQRFIMNLQKSTIAFKDLQRTVVLISNALPDMFRYLTDQHIHSTTNALEGFHSRLKTDYQRHRGLIRKHRINYIQWYCYFKNCKNNNIQ